MFRMCQKISYTGANIMLFGLYWAFYNDK